jgi:branched-chain amino acid transport system permease protein
VLGGAGTLVGGVIGAAVVFALREYLSTLVPWWQYALGGVYVLTIFYLPTGLMGIPARVRQRRAALRNRGNSKELASVAS